MYLSDARDVYPLGRHIEYLEDKTGELTILDVASSDGPDRQFLVSRKNVLSMGVAGAAFWVRLLLRNNSGGGRTDWRLAVKPATLDFIDLWIPDDDGRLIKKSGGDRRPFKVRDVEHHYTVFKLDLPARSERTVYLRIQNRGLMILDMELWHADAFYSRALGAYLFLGLFFGALSIMMAYNLFLFGALKDSAYFHYVLFLFFMTLQFATFRYGLSFQYLWPDSPVFNQIAPFLFSNCMMFFALNFVLTFLRTSTLVPVLHRWLKGLRTPFLIFALASVFTQSRWLVAGMVASTLGAICLMMAAGILAWRKGYRPARYYMLAWGLFWLNTMVAAIHIGGFASIPDHARFLPVVVAAMVLLLSLALADRINLLRRETAGAEAASKAKTAFLANMSHELRTPLNAILGFSRILSQNTAIAGEDRERLTIILRNGEHLLSLINQVLDLSKIEAGKMSLDETCFDLHRLLDELANTFSLRAREKKLYLRFDLSNTVPRCIHADDVKLRQILINLLKNAIKFTEKGGVGLRARAAGSEASPPRSGPRASEPAPGVLRLTIEIEDTGVGIAPGEMDKIFHAYGQTESGRRKKEGTGLGLQISLRFARLMGGDIQVKSRPGRGSVFTIGIPVRVADASDARPPATPVRLLSPAPDQPDYRFLIADDQPDNRQLLKTLLNRFGFRAMEAADGREAVKIWREWKPHLIWMDMRMPVADGYEAVKEIRKMELEGANDGSPPRTRIIAVTAGAYGKESDLVRPDGCDDLVRKPFEEARIFEMLETHLGIRFIHRSKPSPEAPPPGDPATTGSLAAVPGEWLDALEKGAGEADFLLLSGLIRRIKEYDKGLSNELESLVKDYRYREMLEMIRSAKKERG